MFCLQLMLPKKIIQESKIRGGKLITLNNCQSKGCMYTCVCEENISKNAFTIDCSLFGDRYLLQPLSFALFYKPPFHVLFLSGLSLPTKIASKSALRRENKPNTLGYLVKELLLNVAAAASS